MKTQISFGQEKIQFKANAKSRMLIHQNELELKAWFLTISDMDFCYIYCLSPYFKGNVNVIIDKWELIIQANEKVEVSNSGGFNNLKEGTYFSPNSVYSRVKSSKLLLPNKSRYNMVSTTIPVDGHLLITLKRWNHM